MIEAEDRSDCHYAASRTRHHDHSTTATPTNHQQQQTKEHQEYLSSNQKQHFYQPHAQPTPPLSSRRPSLRLQNISIQQSGNLIPLTLNSHLLAAAGSQAATTSPALGSDASQTQFALSPEARACVTATYLCVLIVNNTWLDCNLLEMLCNSAGNGRSGQSGSSTATATTTTTLSPLSPDEERRRAREQYLAAVAETTLHLKAFESALEELVAFAGGGAALRGTHQDGAGRSSLPTFGGALFDPDAGAKLAVGLRSMLDSASKPAPELLEDKGGGARSQFYGSADDFLSQLLLQNSQSNLDSYNLGANLGAANRHRQRQEGESIASKEEDEAVEQYLSVLFNNKLRDLAEKSSSASPSNNGTSADQQVDATTQVPTTSSGTTGSSSIGWLGRPFRGFSPFSFWSGNSESGHLANQAANRQLQQQQQQQHPQQYQYLRPLDGNNRQQIVEQTFNNDIIQMYTSTQPQQQNFTWAGGHRGAPVIDHLNNNNNNQAAYFHNSNQPYQSQVSNNNNINSPAQIFSNIINSSADQQQQPTIYQQIEQHRPPFRVVATGANNLQTLQQQQQQQQQQSADLPQQQYQLLPVPRRPQQQAPDEPMIRCKCDELDIESQSIANGSADCQFRCQQNRDTLSSAQEVGGQLITSTTFVTPSTTLGPSAKMSPIDVTFLLYTRSSSISPHELSPAQPLTIEQLAVYPFQNDSQPTVDSIVVLEDSPLFGGFNSSIPVKIVIHGFGSGGRKPWVSDMVLKLLEYEDAHVIVVDWEKGAAMPNYVQAAGNTRLVGHKIATLIKSINAKFGLTGNNYHLIGFSLGAHVAGFAGMEIRNSSSSPRFWINRITGLDPASPLFEGYEANDRLDPSDAQFVDVIHSNGDGVLRGGFGSLQPMGHVDFYPNGGRVQVGCNSVLLSALSDIIYGKWQSLCNHRRALNFFMDSFESKNNCRFRSFSCDSYESYLKGECFDCGLNNEKCSYMGYMADHSKGRGKMYLTTHEEAPFCANQFTIKILGTKGFKSHWGKVEVTLVSSDGKNESFWLSSMTSHTQSGGHHSDLMSGAGGGSRDLSSQQQHSMQSLIVAHTSLVNFTQVLLRYTKYKGWIYSGDENWPIDKVFITDSEGQVKSFCGFNTVLESHITSRLQLESGNCTVQVEQSVVVVNPAGTSPQANQQQVQQVPTPSSQQQSGSVSVSSSQQQQQQQQVPRASNQAQAATLPTPQQQQQVMSNQHLARTPRLFGAEPKSYQRMAPSERQFALPLFNLIQQQHSSANMPTLVAAF